MNQSPAGTQKRKRSLPLRTGCLKLLLIPILLAVACYGGMWLFARYGGEWAMSDQFFIPDNTQVLKVSYGYGGVGNLSCKTSIYSHSFLPTELRDWFTQQGELIVSREYANFIDGTSWRQPRQTWKSVLHQLSLSLSTSSDTDRNLYTDMGIYRSREEFVQAYPYVVLPDGMSAFEVTICWPNLLNPMYWGLF
jgi:hypothetical protein